MPAPVAIVGTQDPARTTASTNALDVTLDRSDVHAIVQAAEGVALP